MISRTTMERSEPKPEEIRMSFMHYCSYCTRLEESDSAEPIKGWTKVGDDELCDRPSCHIFASQAEKQLANASKPRYRHAS